MTRPAATPGADRYTAPMSSGSSGSPASHSARGAGPGHGATGLLVVLSGPSGVGKSTLARSLRERFGAIFSVSATTRARTAQDVEGADYLFVDEPRFRAMIAEGAFLEHAQVFGRHWYGTPRTPVEAALAEGRIVLLDVDVQGGLQVRRALPDALLVFIEPPDEATLLARLRARARDDEEAIARRFSEARREMETAHASGAYDLFIVNDDLARARAELAAAVERRLAARRG